MSQLFGFHIFQLLEHRILNCHYSGVCYFTPGVLSTVPSYRPCHGALWSVFISFNRYSFKLVFKPYFHFSLVNFLIKKRKLRDSFRRKRKNVPGEIFSFFLVFFWQNWNKKCKYHVDKKFNSAPVLRVKRFKADGAFQKFHLDELACWK